MAASTAVALGGMALSGYSASRQRRAGRQASRQQQESMDRQTQVAQEQLDFSRGQYQDWRDMFQPVENDLKMMAYENQDPDYGAINADVGAAFDTSQDINRRQQQRYGLNPSDGAMQQGEVSYGIGRAGAMVNARNQARTANKDSQFNRLSSFYGMGQGRGQQAANMVSAASAGVSSAYGQHAGMYGNQAQQHNAGAAGAMGDMAGWAGWGYGQSQGRQTGG